MSKVGICIDPHITDRHRCRKDNFLEAALNKLDYIASNNDYVIIAGDLFHTSNNASQIFYKVYSLMKKHEGKFLAIPGNHDLLHNNLGTLDRTTIGSLALTGALHLFFDQVEIDGVIFRASHVMKNLDKFPIDTENNRVLIGHNYLEMMGSAKESFTKDELRKLNYKLVFLGHDHKPYEELFLGNSTVIRMGSLTRIDTQSYNKERKIYYYQLDTRTMNYKKVEVPSALAKDIYTDEAFNRIGRVKEDISFIKIGDVLAKFKKKEVSANSLNSKLLKIASQKEIDYIKSLHELNNIRYF